VGVGIDARLALRSSIALAVIRPADADEILSENALIERVHSDDW
jgi:hypothetical protein